MKRFAGALIVVLFFISCNTIQNRDRKIKYELTSYYSRGLNRDDMEGIDSIQLIRVDSLTEVISIREYMSWQEERITGLVDGINRSEQSIKHDEEQLKWYKTHGYNGSNYIEYIQRENDHKKILLAFKDKAQFSLDSLRKLLTTAQNEYSGLKAKVAIYYRVRDRVDTLISTERLNASLKIEDTGRPLRNTIDWYKTWKYK